MIFLRSCLHRKLTFNADGLKWRERVKKFLPESLSRSRSQSQPRSRSRSLSPASSSVSSALSAKRPHTAQHSSSKSVAFTLSPQSSQTLRLHRSAHEQQAEEEARKEEEVPALSEEQLATLRPVLNRRRSSSDPPSSKSVSRRRKREIETPPESEDEVEVLPDRFDTQGRPVGGGGTSGAMRWRQGAFESRPRNGKGLHSSGAWAVGGTDGDVVQKIASDIEGVISGQSSWKSLLKDVVGAVQEVQHGGDSRRIENSDDDDYDDRRRRRRKSR